jgi:hypothetical protein
MLCVCGINKSRGEQLYVISNMNLSSKENSRIICVVFFIIWVTKAIFSEEKLEYNLEMQRNYLQ